MNPAPRDNPPAGPAGVPADVLAAIAALTGRHWAEAEQDYTRHRDQPGAAAAAPHDFEHLTRLRAWLTAPPAGYYRSLLLVEVLSAAPGAAAGELADVAWQITEGCSAGRVTPLVTDQEVPAAAMAALLSARGCDRSS